MSDSGGMGNKEGFLASSNGFHYQLNDLVDFFVGTGPNIRGPKTIPQRGRFKGVWVEGGVERFLVRPFVSSQHGRCPSYPPEFCWKVKAFGMGMDQYGESKSQYFSKLKSGAQQRLHPPRLTTPPYP